MGIALGDQVTGALATLRTARGALDDLATNPALADDAHAVIAGGGAEAVTALVHAHTPGATKLRDAWQGADELRRMLPGLATRLDGEQGAAANLSAAHADAAADLLDVHVFGGGRHFDAAQLRSTAGEQLDRAITQLEGIRVETPRRMRAWEVRWQDGR